MSRTATLSRPVDGGEWIELHPLAPAPPRSRSKRLRLLRIDASDLVDVTGTPTSARRYDGAIDVI